MRRQDGLVPLVDQLDAHRVDEGRLACPGDAGNADPDGTPGMRQQLAQHLLCPLLMVFTGRFDQGDGFRQRAPLTGQYTINQLLISSGKFGTG